MSPRQKFDRYMLVIGVGRHRKLRKLTDSEFRAHMAGILSLAAQSPQRGYLLITEGVEVDADDIANEAGGQVTPKIAASAIEKLRRVGILERDDEVGAWFVHDWWDVNPEPRPDPTNAQRQADFRLRNGASNGAHNDVSNADVTASNAPEVEVEEEVPEQVQVARPRRASRRIDQSQPPDNLTAELLASLVAVLPILRGVWEIRGGIEPQTRGVGLALNRNPRADHQAVARRLEHWLLAGKGQRARCADVAARFGDWVADETSARPAAGNVITGRFSEYDKAAGL